MCVVDATFSAPSSARRSSFQQQAPGVMRALNGDLTIAR